MSKQDKSKTIPIPHKFLDRRIDPEAQTIIIGTFNPAADKNPATFFYSRGRNYFWRLLPTALKKKEEDMKKNTSEEKNIFIRRHKIDLIDLIAAVQVEQGKETSYADDYIDSRVTQWRNVVQEISRLNGLKRVCFTRKTFTGIPRMKEKIEEVQEYCENKAIVFKCLTTPARFYSNVKQDEWNNFFNA
jgi:G:T/U-mismatch repair DNA glycosylase